MKKSLILLSSLFFSACQSSTSFIEPMSLKRGSIYIEPNDIQELAKGMVENLISSNVLSNIRDYSFKKISNRSCEDIFDTEIIVAKIEEQLKLKTHLKENSNSIYSFKGILFQQCPYENETISVTTTLSLKLLSNQSNIPIWSHEVSLFGKSQKKDWVLY